MSEDKQQHDPVEPEELDNQNAELLPEREVMSKISPTADVDILDLPVEPRDGV
jgi:hypothetical protein